MVDLRKWTAAQTSAVRSFCRLYGHSFNPRDHSTYRSGLVAALIPTTQDEKVLLMVDRAGHGELLW